MEGIGRTALLLLLMKLSSGYVGWEFVHYQRMSFSLENQVCQVSQQPRGSYSTPQIILAVFGLVGPVTGGLAANVFGLTRVARVGGVLVWLPAIGIMVSFSSDGLLCDSPLRTAIWLALFFLFSFTSPAVLALVVTCSDHLRSADGRSAREGFRTLLVLLYYTMAALGLLTGLFPIIVSLLFLENARVDWVALVACLVYTVCAWSPTRLDGSRGIAWPNFRTAWFNRWCQMAAFMLLFSVCNFLGCASTSIRELQRFTGLDSSSPRHLALLYSFVPVLLHSLGAAVTSVTLAGLALAGCGALTGEAGRCRRLRAGLVLEMALQATYLVCVLLIRDPRPRLFGAVCRYALLSLGEGASGALAMGAMFELLAASAPKSARSVALCIGITTWDLSISLSSAVALGFDRIPENYTSVHYAVCIVILLISLLQLNFLALPLARRMETAAQCADEEVERLIAVEAEINAVSGNPGPGPP